VALGQQNGAIQPGVEAFAGFDLPRVHQSSAI